MPIIVLPASTVVLSVPGPPSSVAATAQDGAVVVGWRQPLTDGGSPVRTYVVTATLADGTVAASASVQGSVFSQTLSPLTNGLTYSITVAAVNAVGFSALSDPVTATPSATAPPVVVEIPPIDAPPDLPRATRPEPMVAAFPVDRTFRPEHWLLSQEEADAL